MENAKASGSDTASDERSDEAENQYERTGPRVIISEITGKSVVSARPGAPLVTSEMVRKELEDFP